MSVLVLVSTLAACGHMKRYPVTVDVARTKLTGTSIPDMAFGKAAHSGLGEATADGVQWAVRHGPADLALGGSATDGDEIMVLHARLTPINEGTGVTVDVGIPAGTDPAKLQSVFDQHPAMADMFRSIAREQVDSVLSGRPFRFAAIRGDMALAAVRELPNIREQMDAAGKAIEQRDHDTMDRAYDAAK